MSVWENLAWVVGGAAVGTPISAAMGSLPAQRIHGGVSLTDAQESARELTDWGVGESLRDLLGTDRRTRRRTSSKADSDVLLFYAAGVFVATYVYAQNAVLVSVVLFWLSVLCFAVTTLVFCVLYLRKVFDGHATGWMLVGTVVYAAVGAIVAYWLVEPPLHGVLGEAQKAIAEFGLGGLFPYVVPLAYQLIGAVSAFAVLLASITLCVANVSAVLIALGAWGSGLWRFMFWLTRWTTHIAAVIAMVVLAAVSLLLSSGLVTDWIYAIQHAITPTA